MWALLTMHILMFIHLFAVLYLHLASFSARLESLRKLKVAKSFEFFEFLLTLYEFFLLGFITLALSLWLWRNLNLRLPLLTGSNYNTRGSILSCS